MIILTIILCQLYGKLSNTSWSLEYSSYTSVASNWGMNVNCDVEMARGSSNWSMNVNCDVEMVGKQAKASLPGMKIEHFKL
ncbi:hypothetical protein D3C78_1666620 [compost metagenome]